MNATLLRSQRTSGAQFRVQDERFRKGAGESLLGVLSFEAKPVAQITQLFLISALAASSLCRRRLVWSGSGSAGWNGKSVEEEDDDIVTYFTFHHNR